MAHEYSYKDVTVRYGEFTTVETEETYEGSGCDRCGVAYWDPDEDGPDSEALCPDCKRELEEEEGDR